MPYTPPSAFVQRLFFGAVIASGSALAVASGVRLYQSDVARDWLILAALTLLTGSFTIRIPRLSIRISVSDAFVFASVLVFGPHVATVIVAIDSLVATLWMRRENRSVFRSAFNLSVASLSIWIAATIFDLMVGGTPVDHTKFVLSRFILPLFTLASLYFLLNSWMIAIALAFEQRTAVTTLWWKHFPWFSLNYFGGVSAAALLVPYANDVDPGAIPIILPFLLISYLTYRTSLGRVQDAQRHLDQMNELYMSTIEALAMAVDAKDQITHGHIRRVQVFAVALARHLGVVDPQQINAIETAALLHDMGKLAIPEHILNKPGKLTPVEFEKMKRHAAIGADLLSSIKFPYPVVPIVRHHHENWDGTGYPSGISGTDIPLGARILSVVDCFDALTSDRPYRPKLSDDEAFRILRERRGKMYDPLVVDTFIRVHSEIAPAAIRAGQETRSVLESLAISGDDTTAPLEHIRASAYESLILSNLAIRLKNPMPVDKALREIAQQLRALTPATVLALYRYDVDSDHLVCEAAEGDEQAVLWQFTIPMGERVTGWCAANRRTSLNSDAYLDLGPLTELFSPRLRSAISTPVVHDGRLLGALSAYSPQQNAFDAADRHFLEYVASIGNNVLGSQSAVRERSSRIVRFGASSYVRNAIP